MLCPWCKKTDLPVHLLKRHMKFCDKSPRPRGRIARKRFEQKEKTKN